MGKVNRLGYAGFEVSDLDRWELFATEVLGMQVARKEGGRSISLRMDNHEQRLVLTKGAADDVAFFGWEVNTEAELDALADRIAAAGIGITRGDAAEAQERRVEKLYHCQDPDGNRVELYFGPKLTNVPFHSAVLTSTYVTGNQGMGHYFHVAKTDRQATLDFYVGLLGLQYSDFIRQELAPGLVADAAFLHCNPRHHSMAVAFFPIVPKHLHHFMIEVASLEDLGRAYDRCRALEFPLELSIGMHPNNKSLSFYVRSPSGFSFEVGWGGIVIEDGWSVKSYDRLSAWGHYMQSA